MPTTTMPTTPTPETRSQHATANRQPQPTGIGHPRSRIESASAIWTGGPSSFMMVMRVGEEAI